MTSEDFALLSILICFISLIVILIKFIIDKLIRKNNHSKIVIEKDDPGLTDTKVSKKHRVKQCKYCYSEINKKAQVCPYCRKRQPVGFFKSVGYVMVFIVVVVFLLPNALEKKQDNMNKAMEASPVNYENYCKVQSGMTYDQVCDLFGKEGKFGYSMTAGTGFGDYTYDYYYWYAPDGSYCLISFIDNEVIIATQVGLEK